ncbi:MAG: folylpolyglutamate synthase/dihydrofolate synthase family protein [bacterium]
MNYLASIAYIESLLQHGIELGLDRVLKLLQGLNDPQLKFPSVLIAGTNGKGSVAAMLSAVLTNAGYKTGLYTSPHLVEYTERIRINEKDVSKELFASTVSKVKGAYEKLSNIKITEFEILTAIAFDIFAEQKIDIAIVEVGMGGRFDATNVLTPLCSVITNVDYDHTEYLGKTLEKIAYEKAGIIKPGIPVVTTESKKEALEVIKKIVGEKKAVLHQITKIQDTRYKQISNIKSPISNFESSLKGDYQKINTAVALKVLDVIKDKGFNISDELIREGLQKVRWPARLEVVCDDPMIIYDGTHNVAGAVELAKELKKIKGTKRLCVVLGMQKNKDISGVLDQLMPITDHFIFTRSSHPGAVDPAFMQQLAKKAGCEVIISPHDAVAAAKLYGDIICVAGSLFLIGDLRKI